MTKEEAFVDWGTMNGWNDETWRKYKEALEIHKKDCEEHPENHKSLPQRHHWRGWSEYNCSCGFCHSCDSSD